jgi:hypothetical protein
MCVCGIGIHTTTISGTWNSHWHWDNSVLLMMMVYRRPLSIVHTILYDNTIHTTLDKTGINSKQDQSDMVSVKSK